MVRLTNKAWGNLDPWECCGQDNYCKRGCHEEGGCNNGCIVPKLYRRLAVYEDTGLAPAEYLMRKDEIRVLEMFKEQSLDAEEAIKIAEARRENRLVILPVNVGAEIFSIRYGEVETGKVWRVEINVYTSPAIWIGFTVHSKLFGEIDGHTRIDLAARNGIYFTREEAEAALKGEHNETSDL